MSETVLLSKSSAVVMPPRPRSAPLERPVFDPAGVPAASTTTPISGVASATGKPGSDYDATGNNCRSPPKALAKDFVRDNSRLVKDLMALLAIREATKDTAAAVVLVGDCPSETPSTLPPASVAGIGIGGGHGDLMLVPVTKAAKNRPETGGGGGGGDQLIAHHHHCEATAVAVASLLHQTATKEFSSLAGEMIAIADDSTNTGSRCNGGAKGTSTTNGSVGGGAGEGTMMILHAAATAPEPNAHESTALETGNHRPNPKDSKPEDEAGEGKVKPPDALARRSLSGPIRTPAAGLNHATAGSVGVGERAAALSGPGVPANDNRCRPSGSLLVVPPLTLEQKLDKLLDGVVKIKTDMQKRIERLGQRVEQVHLDVQLNIDSTDRALLRNDLLLIGIPRREREDLAHYFRCVCIALDYTGEDIPEVDIRRQQRRRRQHSVRQRQRSSFTAGDGDGDDDRPRRKDCDAATTPILVEFMFKTMRDQFYRAYQAKRVLRLSDLGLPSDRRFYVNEALTKYNRKLMAEAVRRKREGLLHSVYTADGLVYVQRAAGDKGTKVTSFANLG